MTPVELLDYKIIVYVYVCVYYLMVPVVCFKEMWK